MTSPSQTSLCTPAAAWVRVHEYCIRAAVFRVRRVPLPQPYPLRMVRTGAHFEAIPSLNASRITIFQISSGKGKSGLMSFSSSESPSGRTLAFGPDAGFLRKPCVEARAEGLEALARKVQASLILDWQYQMMLLLLKLLLITWRRKMSWRRYCRYQRTKD